MSTLGLIITDAGRAAIVSETNAATLPVTITEVAVGSGAWAPDATATALNTEIKRLTAVGGGVVADDTLHVTGTDESTDLYTVYELGLYTDGGVLFAIYSQATPIVDKDEAILLMAFDCVFTTIAPGTINVGAAGFNNPPASETVPGVVELATIEEVQTGTDTARAVTPAGVKDRIDNHTHFMRYSQQATPNSVTIAAGASWYPTEGDYIVIPNDDVFRYEVNISNQWRIALANFTGGFFWQPTGQTARLVNTDVVSRVIFIIKRTNMVI